MDSSWCICKELSQGRGTDTLDFIEWGMDVSVYNPCSGDTHLLNLFPFEILQFFLAKSASLLTVAEHMADLCGADNDKKWQDKILMILQQLEELELIEHQE